MIQRYRNDIEAKGEIEKKEEMIFGLRENKLYLENDLALKVEEIATLKNEIAKACVIIAEGLKIVEELEQQIAALKEQVQIERQATARISTQKGDEIAALKKELKLNSSMLARQCDLAREAEMEAAALKEKINQTVIAKP